MLSLNLAKEKTMKKFPSIFAIPVIAVALMSLGAAPQTKTGGAAEGNAENGKRIFVKNGCYQCHGYDGHGGPGTKLAPNPLILAAFIAYVRHPPPGGMPVYSPKVMSDPELADVWSYLKTIPQTRAVKDIPLLNK
jgi:mono/diheme cytochrome c family protein